MFSRCNLLGKDITHVPSAGDVHWKHQVLHQEQEENTILQTPGSADRNKKRRCLSGPELTPKKLHWGCTQLMYRKQQVQQTGIKIRRSMSGPALTPPKCNAMKRQPRRDMVRIGAPPTRPSRNPCHHRPWRAPGFPHKPRKWACASLILRTYECKSLNIRVLRLRNPNPQM